MTLGQCKTTEEQIIPHRQVTFILRSLCKSWPPCFLSQHEMEITASCMCLSALGSGV